VLSFSFITVHPAFIEAYMRFGVFASAQRKGLASAEAVDLRRFAVDKHGSIDASPYGGGDGMVLRPEPLADALKSLSGKPRCILTSPSGKLWTQADGARLARSGESIAFICGRFGGVDQRFIDAYVDEELSVGDYVVSGGELPALMMADSILRLIPGVLGNETSAANDSFGSGMAGLLEYPLYTRPEIFEGKSVPPVLLSGDHAAVAAWREREAREKTRQLRPELLG